MTKAPLLLLPGLLLSFSVRAFEPAAIPVGDAELTPQISLEYFSDDNVFAQANNAFESPGLIIQPEVEFRASRGLNAVTLGYKGYYQQYTDAENLDYNDHQLSAGSVFEFSSRSKLTLSGLLEQKSEKPGYGLMDDADESLEALIEYNNNRLGGVYHYGSASSVGGLEFGLDIENKDYQNEPAETDGYSYSSVKPNFTFLYRLSPDTRLTVGLDYASYNHNDGDIASLDRSTYGVTVGSRWQITGRSGGNLKVGYGSRDFKTNDREDDSSALLSLGAYWLPLSYSRFDLDVSRSFVVETSTPTIKNQLTANWRHAWSSRVSSFVNVRYADLDSDDDSDDQTTTTAKLGFDVSLSRWSALTFAASNTDRDAQDIDNTFKRQQFSVGFKLSL